MFKKEKQREKEKQPVQEEVQKKSEQGQKEQAQQEEVVINLTTLPHEPAPAAPATLVNALEEALTQMDRLQNLEKEKASWYKQVARCANEAKWRSESSQKILRDCISRILEPTQEKLLKQGDLHAEVKALKLKSAKDKDFYEDVIIAKDDEHNKAKRSINNLQNQLATQKQELERAQKHVTGMLKEAAEANRNGEGGDDLETLPDGGEDSSRQLEQKASRNGKWLDERI